MLQCLINIIRTRILPTALGPIASSVGTLIKGVLRRLPGEITVKKRISGVGPFRFHSDYVFTDFEHWATGHNSAFADLVEECSSKNCVLDIGAHIGITALPISSVLAPGGRVHAFEASTTNLKMLRFHIRKNSVANIDVVPRLVGDQNDSGVIFFQNKRVSGMNSVVKQGSSRHWETIPVDMISLDHYCLEYGLMPEVIKIDVEGGEEAVLRGGRRTLRQFNPIVFLSVHPRHLNELGSSVEQLKLLIESFGYRIEYADGSPVGTEVLEFSEYRLEKK